VAPPFQIIEECQDQVRFDIRQTQLGEQIVGEKLLDQRWK
jgi:hypothetical protein